MGIKSKALKDEIDLFDKSIVVRFDKKEYKERQQYVMDIGLSKGMI